MNFGIGTRGEVAQKRGFAAADVAFDGDDEFLSGRLPQRGLVHFL